MLPVSEDLGVQWTRAKVWKLECTIPGTPFVWASIQGDAFVPWIAMVRDALLFSSEECVFVCVYVCVRMYKHECKNQLHHHVSFFRCCSPYFLETRVSRGPAGLRAEGLLPFLPPQYWDYQQHTCISEGFWELTSSPLSSNASTLLAETSSQPLFCFTLICVYFPSGVAFPDFKNR